MVASVGGSHSQDTTWEDLHPSGIAQHGDGYEKLKTPQQQGENKLLAYYLWCIY